VTYLRWQDYAAWSACPGRPALEESEGEIPDEVPRLTATDKLDLDERKTALQAVAAVVEVMPLQALEVGQITGERGALGFGSVVLAEYQDHAALEVYPPDKILGLAALVKYSILHAFTSTNVGTPEELFTFGQQVTEAAQLSLNLRASVTALEHLVPGDYCRTCRSAYRCPALTKDIHEEVFGPLEAPEDPDAKPQDTFPDDPEWIRVKLPVIEHWVERVKARLRIKEKPAPVTRRRRKTRKSKKPARDLSKP
jgi:hypothetical protein